MSSPYRLKLRITTPTIAVFYKAKQAHDFGYVGTLEQLGTLERVRHCVIDRVIDRVMGRVMHCVMMGQEKEE